MDEVELLATSTDPLLSCCMCKRLLHEAVQLKCLHNCCRQCFSTAASTVGSQGVSCVSCDAITQAGSEQPNGFIDGQVRRYGAVAASRVCGVCKGNGEHDKPALVWCPPCRHSLCGDCVAGHRQYFRQHVTQSLEELNSLDEVCSQPPVSACAIHKKPLDVACRSCAQAKCISCWTVCNQLGHEMLVVGNESFDIYVGKFISSIASIESDLLRKSEVLEKPKRLRHDAKVARDRHLEEITQRKRRVIDAVEKIYQEMVFTAKNAYDELEAQRDAAAAVADRINAALSDARNYIRRLVESDDKCVILNQQKIVRERLSTLAAEVDSLSERLATTMREVKIEVSLPDDVEDVVRAWIGIPRVYAASSSPVPSPSQLNTQQQQSQQQQQASSLPPTSRQKQQQQQSQQQASSSPPPCQQQQQQSFSFGGASASFKLPVYCEDVALTQDGRSLLLAARQYGLVELNSANGRELSRWRPPKHSSGLNDEMRAVAALSDGRAAVNLFRARFVVLLRRRNSSSSTGGAAAMAAAGDYAWTEDRRLQLPWPACGWLSAHGDLLAVNEWHGQRLQLLSLSSGRQLSDTELQCEYNIGSLAVAARLVVTGSSHKVELGGDRRAAHVLDAHSLDAVGVSDKRLWRYVLSSSDSNQQEEELLRGVCVDSSGGCLYAAVRRSDMSGGRVSVLSLADGSELRRVALSFHSAAAAPQLSLLLPRRLSLCDDGAAEQHGSSSRKRDGRMLLLAVLCWDHATGGQRTVTLHRSANNMLQ